MCAATDNKLKTSTNSMKTTLELTLEFARSLDYFQEDPDYLAIVNKYEDNK